MKKENYVCLVLGIIALTVWIIDILGFFKLTEIWEFIKGGYALLGLPVSLACFIQAIPTDKNDKIKKICSICGGDIMKNENSIHYHPAKGELDTIDYCEKCKDKVIV